MVAGDRTEECFHLAKEILQETAERQKRDHDTRLCEILYSAGDAVYKRNGLTKKLDKKYSGPFIITKSLSPAVCEIRNKTRSMVVHHDRIKPYETEKLPRWATALQKKYSC